MHLESHKEFASKIISTYRGGMLLPPPHCNAKRNNKPAGPLHLIDAQLHADQKPEPCVSFSLTHRDPRIYLDLMSSDCRKDCFFEQDISTPFAAMHYIFLVYTHYLIKYARSFHHTQVRTIDLHRLVCYCQSTNLRLKFMEDIKTIDVN